MALPLLQLISRRGCCGAGGCSRGTLLAALQPPAWQQDGSCSSWPSQQQHHRRAGAGASLHTSSSGDALVDAAAAAAAAAVPPIFSAGAAALEGLHSLSGLPWWAVIPLTAFSIKSLLLPLSLKQAKVVRMNMVLWTEAYELQQQQRAKQQQQQQQQQQSPGAQQQPKQEQQHSADAAVAALQQLQQWQQRIQLYHSLRRKCGVPHPAWVLANSGVQIPLFVYAAASIRSMAQAGWPGFASEGALWFPDLTQPALQVAQAGLQLPMGLPGLVLPLAATTIMLTSIHLGFKASGTAAKHPSVAGTWMATLLSSLRPLLYALTLLSAAVKVQLPQAAVLHWTTTSSFTLALQLGLRSPRVRQLLGYNTQPGALGSSGSASVDPGVATQAAAVDNADVLVVMGAKHAALHHYNEALHCLGRALQLDPHNARAHYSSGQIHALQQQWQRSEDSYRSCAVLTRDASSQAQALYCVGVACHQQGKHQAALDAYQEAAAAGPPASLQPMLALGSARALERTGAADKAAAVAAAFLAGEHAHLCAAPVADALRALAAAADGAADNTNN